MTFADVLPALQAGERVRRAEAWEAITVMYADGDDLYCKRGDGTPYNYQLPWFDIAATDWSLAN